MGVSTTIIKPSVSLQEWLCQSQSIIEQTSISAYNHIVGWRIASHSTAPIDLNPREISTKGVFLIFACRDNSKQPSISASYCSLLNEVMSRMEPLSLRCCIKSKCVEGCLYSLYVLVGKEVCSELKICAIQWALRLDHALDSRQRIGCLCRQGEVCEERHESQLECELRAEVNGLHIVQFMTDGTIPVGNAGMEVQRKTVVEGKLVKPPMLKLSLKPYEEVTYEQILEEQERGVLKFDIRATARHQLKMEHCQKECNMVVEGLFVAGEKVAKSQEILKKYRIGAIINCAADYCQNWFQNQSWDHLNGEKIQYLTFFLKDSQHQNIECLFYKAIQFIQNAQKFNKNVLVHCIQGVSRSVSIVAAFLIFKYGYDYKKTELFLKQKRPVACPNNGFMVQLIQFHKRIYEDYSALALPRVFLVSMHAPETPNLIVARLLKSPLFEPPRCLGFDARALYIVQTIDTVYIWVGSRCEEKRLQLYWSYAQEYIKKIQDYERAPLKVKAISQGSEGREFFMLWNLTDPPALYESPELDKFFCDSQPGKPGALRKMYEREPSDSLPAKLFIAPDYQSGLGVFQQEDLSGFCVVANAEGQRLQIFLWGEVGEENENFLDDVLKTHYGQYDSSQINVIEEDQKNPSESFLACFS